MINQDQKLQLIESLLRMFHFASNEAKITYATHSRVVEDDADKDIAPLAKDILRNYRATLPVTPKPHAPSLFPQVCAILLSTGQVIGGVASNPVTYKNRDGEDAVQIATAALENHPALSKNFQIVALAMTTITDADKPVTVDLELYEQSLSELPNLKASNILLVDPLTERTAHSAPFSDFQIV